MQIFSEELEKRKIEYFEAKERKDEAFREIEHLKTSSRLLESRMKKKLQAKGGVSYPLKLEIGITEADLDKNKLSILGNQYEQDLKIFYKIDNGKEAFTSAKVGDIGNPSWADIFNIELQNSKEKLFFQIISRIQSDENTDKIIDSFDLSAGIIDQQLKVTEYLTDNISTSVGNHFTLSIKGAVAVNPKLQFYRDKITENELIFQNVEPPYKEARSKYEKFLNYKGSELLEEWGICGNDFKLIKHPKGDKNELQNSEESKIIELDMDHLDRSYLGSSMRLKKSNTIRVKKAPEKNTKHSFKNNKHSPGRFDSCGIVEKVDLIDIGDIDIPRKVEKKNDTRATSAEEVKKRIEKKHLYKPYKTNAIIHEGNEDSFDSPEKSEEDKKNGHLSPSQKLMQDEIEDAPVGYNLNQKLTSDALRMNNLGTKRTGLGSSLINFAMQDLTHKNKVKSVYNQSTGGAMKIGGLFNQLSINNTLAGMMMMNNNATGVQSFGMGMDEDNCSLISGNTFQTFQNFGNTTSSNKTKPYDQ